MTLYDMQASVTAMKSKPLHLIGRARIQAIERLAARDVLLGLEGVARITRNGHAFVTMYVTGHTLQSKGNFTVTNQMQDAVKSPLCTC